MTSYQLAFVGAGCIGCFVAVIHGVIMQKKMIKPIIAGIDLPAPTRRLLPLLLHFSTLFWFLGGAAMIVAPFFASKDVLLTTAVFVAVLYSFGAVGNFWGTRGRHPGWALLAVAAALILYGANQLID